MGKERATKTAVGQTATMPGREPVSADSDTVAASIAAAPTVAGSQDASSTGGAALDLPVVDPARYGDRKELAAGGMGRIVTARDRTLGRRVAIKELRAQTPALRARFEREALLTARLEHPSVVGIHEAGTWPSGEPFYAMRLVSGDPLDRLIDRAETFAERIALLPNVLAVADAMAYAHEQRIIHRDLKPHNVLVGRFGETVVIDWGLAKDLDSAEIPLPTVDVDDPNATTIGTVLGTPAFMPPEQADGDQVDERADVYAIGAVLYHVLAGHPPYVGRSSDAILTSVRLEPPPPIGEREPKTPADLRAIVERAMARSPADRYPTARGLADDLRRFQAGQLVGAHAYTWRQRLAKVVRRHRTAFAVGGLAVVALAIVGAISIRQVVHERGVAVEARGDAEKLVGFMLNDLRKQLASIGRLDLLEPIADAASKYYAQRPLDGADTAELQQRGALAIALGDARTGRHDSPGALVWFREALELRRRVVERAPDPAGERELGEAERKVAAILHESGDAAGSQELLRASLARANQRLAIAPDDTEALREASIAHQMLALRMPREPALVEIRAATALIERAMRIAPGSDWQIERAKNHEMIADKIDDADPKTALAELRAAQAIYDKLAVEGADELQERAALNRIRISRVHQARRELPDATQELHLASAALGRLVERDPANARRARSYAVANHQLADVLAADGDRGAAINMQRRSLEAFATIAKLDPKSTASRVDLAGAHQQLGKLLGETDAEAGLAELAIARELHASITPRTPVLDRELAVTIASMGEIERARGDAAAIATLRDALARFERLAAADASIARQIEIVVVQASIVQALAKDNPGEARAELARATTRVRALEKTAAGDPRVQMLANALVELAAVVDRKQ